MSTRYRVITSTQRDEDDTALFIADEKEVVAWLMAQPNVKGVSIQREGSDLYLTVGQFFASVVSVVPKFYTMNTKTEDLLPDGTYLANGMKVLTANSGERGRPEEAEVKDWIRDRVMESNRWCTVSHLKIIGANVSFVAAYDDGTKRKRSTSLSTGWFVKKDSVAESMSVTSERHNTVYKLVEEAMTTVAKAMRSKESEDAKALKVGQKAEETTKAILGLL